MITYFRKFYFLILLVFSLSHSQLTSIRNEISQNFETNYCDLIHINQFSNDGKWVLFMVHFKDQSTYNYAISSIENDNVVLENGTEYSFSNNSKWLAYIKNKKELIILNLVNKEEIKFNGYDKYEFDQSGNYIVASRIGIKQNLNLLIINLNDNSTQNILNIHDYSINPKFSRIAISQYEQNKNKLFIYDFKNKNTYMAKNDSVAGPFKHLEWSVNGKYLAAADLKMENQKILFFDNKGSGGSLTLKEISTKYINKNVDFNTLKISNDGSQIFFDLIYEKNDINEYTNIEFWDSLNKYTWPESFNKWNLEIIKTPTYWNTNLNFFHTITDSITPSSKINVNHKKAIVFNRLLNSNEYLQNESTDLYIVDLENKTKSKFLENFYNNENYITLSPLGNLISYFKNNNWWVYYMKSNIHRCLTCELPQNFYKKDSKSKTFKDPYGSPGWLNDEEYVLLYDEYDIWAFNILTDNKLKITNGRNNKIRYRIFNDSNSFESAINSKNSIGLNYNFKSPIILKMLGDNLQSGYALWENLSTIKTIIYSEEYIDNLKASLNYKKFVFTSQKYNQPPSVNFLSLKDMKTKKLYQSNPELYKNYEGKFEVFKYTNSNNDTLNAALLYPFKFQNPEKYPLIVYIYQNSSENINKFNTPINNAMLGFKFIDYLENGYFILLPDINYEIGNPGNSALDCVESSIKKILKYNFIDRENIGLIGHSFGGYEAAYIATRTKFIKTVVAGSPVTDLVSWYHDFSWDFGTQQAWRLENQQFRMGDSYYNMKENYKENSPLYHVEKLEIPLFIWTGHKDGNINSNQSILMFNGMKRLKKPGKLLYFKDEGHVIINKKNQLILSNEIFNWFDKYLKN